MHRGKDDDANEKYYIVISDCFAKKQKDIRAMCFDQALTEGTLLREVFGTQLRGMNHHEICVENLDAKSLCNLCVDSRRVDAITADNAQLLLALPDIRKRWKFMKERVGKDLLDYANSMKVDKILSVCLDGPKAIVNMGRVLYKGPVPEIGKGWYFGVHLLGVMSEEVTPCRKDILKKYIPCGGYDPVVFVSFNKLHFSKGFLELDHIPASHFDSNDQPAKSGSLDGCPLDKGDRVVWISNNGKAEHGVVRWYGKLPEEDDPNIFYPYVGIEFDNPVGNGTGEYKQKTLFNAKPGHASLMPPDSLIRESDFKSPSHSSSKISLNPFKNKKKKKKGNSTFFDGKSGGLKEETIPKKLESYARKDERKQMQPDGQETVTEKVALSKEEPKQQQSSVVTVGESKSEDNFPKKVEYNVNSRSKDDDVIRRGGYAGKDRGEGRTDSPSSHKSESSQAHYLSNQLDYSLKEDSDPQQWKKDSPQTWSKLDGMRTSQGTSAREDSMSSSSSKLSRREPTEVDEAIEEFDNLYRNGEFKGSPQKTDSKKFSPLETRLSNFTDQALSPIAPIHRRTSGQESSESGISESAERLAQVDAVHSESHTRSMLKTMHSSDINLNTSISKSVNGHSKLKTYPAIGNSARANLPVKVLARHETGSSSRTSSSADLSNSLNRNFSYASALNQGSKGTRSSSGPEPIYSQPCKEATRLQEETYNDKKNGAASNVGINPLNIKSKGNQSQSKASNINKANGTKQTTLESSQDLKSSRNRVAAEDVDRSSKQRFDSPDWIAIFPDENNSAEVNHCIVHERRKGGEEEHSNSYHTPPKSVPTKNQNEYCEYGKSTSEDQSSSSGDSTGTDSAFALGLELGSVVEVSVKGEPMFGVIRWIGNVPKKSKLVAGIEMEEEADWGNDGVFHNNRYFKCSSNKAFFTFLSNCRKDSRFLESMNSARDGRHISADFGSIECPTVEGDVEPLSYSDKLLQLLGKNRGIQGHHNSCYLDATLFSMFTFTGVFDNVLFRPPTSKDIDQYGEVQRVLKEEIVNPLRQSMYVRADRVMKLRMLLEDLSSVTGLTSEEKDPEEFLNSLLHQILQAEPLLKLSSGQDSYFYQLFVDKKESLKVPTVQQLFDQSFLNSDIKLKEIPSCLIIQMPRFGKQFKTYPRIFPDLSLDITNVLEHSPRECHICGKLADYVCSECNLHLDKEEPLKAYCQAHLETVHKHPHRTKHNPRRVSIPSEFSCLKGEHFVPRVTMDLFAVVCIETSHYVAFVKCGNQPDSPWCFFDSMADRRGEKYGYNIPEVILCPELLSWLSPESSSETMALLSMDDKMLPELAKRLFGDAYMCMYQSPLVSMYQ